MKSKKRVYCINCTHFLIIRTDTTVTVTCTARCHWVGNSFRARVSVSGFSKPYVLNEKNNCALYQFLPSLRVMQFKRWLLSELDAEKGTSKDLASCDISSNLEEINGRDEEEETEQQGAGATIGFDEAGEEETS